MDGFELEPSLMDKLGIRRLGAGKLEFKGDAALAMGGTRSHVGVFEFEPGLKPVLVASDFGSCRLSAADVPPFAGTITQADSSAVAKDVVMVLLHLKGEVAFEREAEPGHPKIGGKSLPPTLMIYEPYDQLHVWSEVDSARIVLEMPRQLLPYSSRFPRNKVHLFKSGEAGLPAIFTSLVLSAHAQRETLADSERTRLQTAFLNFTADLLASRIETELDGALGLAALRARAIAYIEKNIRDISSVDEIAESLRCSPRSIYKALSVRGTTPAKYIWTRRIERAYEVIMTADPEISIAQIAEECGFRNYAHFSKMYKERYGVSPRQARKETRA